MAERLALLGGRPVIGAGEIDQPWPIHGETERRYLSEVLESGQWWRGGSRTDTFVTRFEDGFAAFQDARHGMAVTNGTAALECAFRAVGVEAGDEVIVPAATFIATATAAVVIGGVPVFADIDPETFTVSPAAIEAALTPRTRCIAIVDYAGMPCDYDAIRAIAARAGVPVVADCAHAHGSQWKGVGVGALTECGTFSFQMGKTLTTGEGGMVLTNDDDVAGKLFTYHNIGRVTGRPFYEHEVAAGNLRMTEWQGAVGLAQLERFPEQVAARDRNSQLLARLLVQLDAGVEPLRRRAEVTRHCFYMWHCRFRSERWDGVGRDAFMAALRAEGVPGLWTGHLEPLYRHRVFSQGNFGRKGFPIAAPYHEGTAMDYRDVHCPETERAEREGVAVNHRFFVGPEAWMEKIAAAVEKVWGGRAELAQWAKERRSARAAG